MRTLLGNQAAAAFAIPEQHQVLAKQADTHRPAILQFRHGRDRLPVAAQKVAHRRAGADLCEQIIELAA